MSKETKLKIGEFSKMMQVTVKTLRYYEQKGLLLPYEVDEWTGYRYYSIYQMQRLNIIRGLQQQGFTLEEIKELLEDGEQMPSIDQLTQKIEETEHQLQLLIKRRSQLLKWLDSHKQIKTMEKVNIQSLPEIIVASHREIIPNYDALGALCVNKIGPEMQRLGCKCPPPGYCFTIEHNKEYRSTDLDIEYCEQVEEKGKDNNIIQFKHLPAVEKALCIKH
jgi:DNA-binding transcriptional MerR regulator